MRVAVYNQMFGLNGRSFFGNIIGHFLVHWTGYPKIVMNRANLEDTINILKKADADIIGICEIFEGQEKEIEMKLRKIGYKYFYYGRGHRFRYSNRHVLELLASKIKGKQIIFKEWPVQNSFGGGGGFVVCYFKKLNNNVFLAHLGIPSKKYFFGQIKHIQEIIKKLKGKIILMGDFNEEYYKIETHFSDLVLVTGKIKTCSMTPILHWFCYKDMDHIMVKGFKKKDIGTFLGNSDHKLIYADLV